MKKQTASESLLGPAAGIWSQLALGRIWEGRIFEFLRSLGIIRTSDFFEISEHFEIFQK